MSVYNTPGSSYALLGGSTHPEHPEVPFLTYQIRSKPNAILLLDEMDKACRDIWMLFLQIFDTGRILDFLGNEIFFDSTTILMTANIGFSGHDAIIDYPKATKSWEDTKAKVLEEVKSIFPPEFLGRIDEILILKPLSFEIMKGFVDQKRKQLEKQNEKSLFLSEKAIDLIIEKGFDKEYGARKLNHALDDLLGALLAECKLGSDWETIKSISFEKDPKKSILKIAKILYRQA
jgi:ATP-dependent Clp protease ATP-binding subunit ClpA